MDGIYAIEHPNNTISLSRNTNRCTRESWPFLDREGSLLFPKMEDPLFSSNTEELILSPCAREIVDDDDASRVFH
jgi:hypothetical protein